MGSVMLELRDFLRSGVLLFESRVAWGDGAIPLNVSCYLGKAAAPSGLVSSVRAIVFRKAEVLIVTEKSGGVYILPGGRVEQGEQPLVTLRREVLEETGWTIRSPRLLGWQHFHHLAPRPTDYPYPYPDFVWPIYLAEAQRFVPTAVIPDDYVFESRFRNIDEVKRLPINKGELLLLEAAVAMRARR